MWPTVHVSSTASSSYLHAINHHKITSFSDFSSLSSGSFSEVGRQTLIFFQRLSAERTITGPDPGNTRTCGSRELVVLHQGQATTERRASLQKVLVAYGRNDIPMPHAHRVKKARLLLQKSDLAWKFRPQTLKSCDSDRKLRYSSNCDQLTSKQKKSTVNNTFTVRNSDFFPLAERTVVST